MKGSNSNLKSTLIGGFLFANHGLQWKNLLNKKIPAGKRMWFFVFLGQLEPHLFTFSFSFQAYDSPFWPCSQFKLPANTDPAKQQLMAQVVVSLPRT